LRRANKIILIGEQEAAIKGKGEVKVVKLLGKITKDYGKTSKMTKAESTFDSTDLKSK